MARDFRDIERELADVFDIAGLDVRWVGGNAFITVASIPECSMRPDCHVAVGPYGKTECRACEAEFNINGRVETISITDIARRLCE